MISLVSTCRMLGTATYLSLWREKSLHTPDHWVPRNLTKVANLYIFMGFISHLLSYKNIYNICNFLFSRSYQNDVSSVEDQWGVGCYDNQVF